MNGMNESGAESQPVVRPAAVADLHLLAELNAALIRDEGHRNSMSVADLASRMEKWLAGPYQAHLIEVAGETAGYVLARPEIPHVYIRQFFIAPPFRRQGRGRAALNWMIRNVWQESPRLRLDVLTENERGIAFWRAMGFTDYCLTMEKPVRLDG